MKPRPLVLALLLTGAVAAGCSSTATGNSAMPPGTTPPGTTQTGTTPQSTASPTVHLGTTRIVGVGTVVDADGRTVYANDQDATVRILCGTQCAAVWTPVTVTAVPPAIGGISFSTVTRSDGTLQLTEQGHPLYTFVGDGASGDAKGQNAKDSFGGQSFTWHAVTVVGSTPGSTQAPPPSGGGGGY
ncbi:COG4315 family predicted lipoprotein [Streptacidiphilus melanogenes]|uniref:COG4315 family predicted lipoprotein n=1 Tax=Streptacidiphilus melanogenes TaxID=411235 RepID=UPI0006936D64|nr:hypothetical protein [Streptacidiphilus melanogenes]